MEKEPSTSGRKVGRSAEEFAEAARCLSRGAARGYREKNACSEIVRKARGMEISEFESSANKRRGSKRMFLVYNVFLNFYYGR